MSNLNDNIKPPVVQIGIVGWLRNNLFSNWYNSLFTVLAVAFLSWFFPPIFQWIFVDAIWSHFDWEYSGMCSKPLFWLEPCFFPTKSSDSQNCEHDRFSKNEFLSRNMFFNNLIISKND